MRAFRMFFVFFLMLQLGAVGQTLPADKVLNNKELSNYLVDSVRDQLQVNANKPESILASYFRERFSERYFFEWQTSETRFQRYSELYPEQQIEHRERANDHMSKYPSATKWKLPFNYTNGEAVNAYAIRHLARQHKMVDIAYQYFYEDKNVDYLNYFTEQLSSLNQAFATDAYETIDDGNGVYEAFRSGYRILNWLHIHNLFLGQDAYSDEEQLQTIATLLQHGQHLFEHNQEFVPGNHQTRGLSALAMLSILFRDFKGVDTWYDHSMKLLQEHLEKEINDDGFQFERTVHYHISDIGNYFYVYQLAKKSQLDISPVWQNKLESLFTTLTKIAYPDKSAPVFSDDTDTPWGEKNDISGALTLGYVLFEDPKFGYFSNNHLDPKFYWNASEQQLEGLNNINMEAPSLGSLAFTDTGYFIMREGWQPKDKMMAISAGLDPDKPDHQHGDMLGIQAMANGRVILPNYQVRYSLKDLELFKNSMTKNVALVDDELQGKDYTSNKGGSGFGKFKNLPNPKVIAFEPSDDLDVFIGSHNGFENVGVGYQRLVLFVNNDFWIVKDQFRSNQKHSYKQVWQGHYSQEQGQNFLRASFEDGSGLDIYQLNPADAVSNGGQRGKQWSVVTKNAADNFSFITIVYPFATYDARIDEDEKPAHFKGWTQASSTWTVGGALAKHLSKNDQHLLFSVERFSGKNLELTFSKPCDLFLKEEDGKLRLQLLSEESIDARVNGKSITLNPGKLVVHSL